ncbi:MAG: HlyD family efflux transporter periplasmic adaptor subunit [Gammaproteobacteria bacterium]|nr:HlyD family efflux transporter periplasmic adaptor subunit [Gammaproteobacteria bacterium]
MVRLSLLIMLVWLLVACEQRTSPALGTLEWDRIALPAPVAEVISSIEVREGQRVEAGEILLQLDDRRTRAQLESLEAQALERRAMLDKLLEGPRIEEIERAQANLEGYRAEEKERRANYNRLEALKDEDFVSQSDVDSALSSYNSAAAQTRAGAAQLLELQRGSRIEDIAQAEAALQQALAQVAEQKVLLEKLTVRAPRTGQVDSLPYKLGDEAPTGGALAIMLVGETPYARVYIPQTLRSAIRVGDRVQVRVEGFEQSYWGRVRLLRNDPSFTPYFALTGDDAARLSYLAEIQLEADAIHLPAGLPVQALIAINSKGTKNRGSDERQ